MKTVNEHQFYYFLAKYSNLPMDDVKQAIRIGIDSALKKGNIDDTRFLGYCHNAIDWVLLKILKKEALLVGGGATSEIADTYCFEDNFIENEKKEFVHKCYTDFRKKLKKERHRELLDVLIGEIEPLPNPSKVDNTTKNRILKNFLRFCKKRKMLTFGD